jgi:hypothetical protein
VWRKNTTGLATPPIVAEELKGAAAGYARVKQPKSLPALISFS